MTENNVYLNDNVVVAFKGIKIKMRVLELNFVSQQLKQNILIPFRSLFLSKK